MIKRILLGAVAAIVLAAAGFMLTFTAATLTLAPVEVGALPPASPPADMSISALPTGTYDTPAALAFRGGGWRDTRHFATTAVLVRHPKGNLLIDAGMGKNADAHEKMLPAMQQAPKTQGTPVVAQLAAGGIQPGDLAGIIPTHAHWDHVSGIEDLAGVPVMINAAGKTFIESGAKGTEVLNSFHGVSYKSYAFEGGPYLGFAQSHDVWGDGAVVIVPAPGHTPDSVIVFVTLPSGKRFALVGDLVWQIEGLDLPAEKPWMLRRAIGEDDVEVHHEIALIAAARKKYPQLHAIPAHDLAAFAELPIFPASAQ